MTFDRRNFIKNVSKAALLAPLTPLQFHLSKNIKSDDLLNVHLFSKHLHFLSIKEAAEIALELGFTGLDLTVRPNGHVLPQNVETDLPIAIGDIKKAGASCELITTAIADANNTLDANIIKTAAENGVQFYRSDWFKYLEGKSMQESISFYQQKIKELSKLNKQNNIVGCYQNHAGTKIGASYWEIEQLLKTADPNYFGTQYDIRHAVVEAGKSWENGLKLLNRSIKTIVIKDFKWGVQNGKWNLINVPIGEGMVDFKRYFKLLKGYGLKPKVSLHLEYPLGGAEKGKNEITVDKSVVFSAMKSDLSRLQKFWMEP